MAPLGAPGPARPGRPADTAQACGARTLVGRSGRAFILLRGPEGHFEGRAGHCYLDGHPGLLGPCGKHHRHLGQCATWATQVHGCLLFQLQRALCIAFEYRSPAMQGSSSLRLIMGWKIAWRPVCLASPTFRSILALGTGSGHGWHWR